VTGTWLDLSVEGFKEKLFDLTESYDDS